MEAFLTTTAGYGARREWGAIKAALRQQPNRDMDARLDMLVDKAKNSFYFHVLSSVASRGTAANRQLFFVSLVMRHKGLSRSGLELLGAMNLGLAPRSFDPELNNHSERVIALPVQYVNDGLLSGF